MEKGERIGIIGGSGLYALEGVETEDTVESVTPYGSPSSPIVLASMDGLGLAFLARHGIGHVLSPSEVPYAANIYALKALGVRRIISVSAVGSLKNKIAPRDVVIPDQLWDRTKGVRRSTFFGEGVVAHVSFGEPYCPCMREILASSAAEAGGNVHPTGDYVCMEGPAFSTRAESRVYRAMACDVIGMTAVPEAKLAREANICYATLALVTDYDAWHESEEEVTVEMVMANMAANTSLAGRILALASKAVASHEFDCGCRNASRNAVMTAPEKRDPRRMEDLRVVLE
ncbi:MAG TPA: S-methyl-5'-thioadenosine phosphorylase [Candidatus Fermentibacter daniensis]|nr:S-methyl-5'-thioadenosine phosphorylase [Candidatus Fermentibacter daniensis]HQH92425.1 S-methyl-5'-thioadenosine phosphorylase [Candidatus Fermentibacter daniensis]